jgi:hypothetical protein
MKRIELRNAREEDWKEIQRLHREQCGKWGIEYEEPRPGRHIAVALVAEDEHGVIRQAVIVERVAEMCLYGIDPKATAFSRRDMQALAFLLSGMRYRWVHCLVPRALRKLIAKPLRRAGFADRADELANFTIQVSR